VPVGRLGAVLVRSFLVRAFHSRAAPVLVGRLGETRQQHTRETKVGRPGAVPVDQGRETTETRCALIEHHELRVRSKLG
jgi:hypothetical protein